MTKSQFWAYHNTKTRILKTIENNKQVTKAYEAAKAAYLAKKKGA